MYKWRNKINPSQQYSVVLYLVLNIEIDILTDELPKVLNNNSNWVKIA